MELTKLEIVTPRGVIFNQDVKSLTVPGSEGEFGILAKHASLVSLLDAGVIEIEKEDGSKELVAIDWGYAKVDESKVSILANGALAISKDGDINKNLDKVDKLFESIADSDAPLAATRARIEQYARG
jgi:F-type H+-transporting ATPase subunit epsilon